MNYGVIGNCQVAALIDEQARMVWACLPRPDGDPVFSALLQKEGGESEQGVFAIDMLDLMRTEQNPTCAIPRSSKPGCTTARRRACASSISRRGFAVAGACSGP